MRWCRRSRPLEAAFRSGEINMTLVRWLVCVVYGVALASPLAARAEAPCKEPELGSNQAPMLSPATANVVTGTGRLQFYSAPNAGCPMNGVFVIPKDELIAYARTDD